MRENRPVPLASRAALRHNGAMAGTGAKLTRAVEDYFADLGRIRGSGGATGELSYHPALGTLLNAVGATLKPRVFCVGELADQGAGRPDFGLYAAKQVQKGRPREGQTPERSGWSDRATERASSPDERAALGDTFPALGETTFDIHLNGEAFWRNVPAAVWNYRIGGYQVFKKWLSYRERDILGRALRPEEVQHFADTARRIGGIFGMTGARVEQEIRISQVCTPAMMRNFL